jgi:Mrp family chromosome partitioning ATPase
MGLIDKAMEKLAATGEVKPGPVSEAKPFAQFDLDFDRLKRNGVFGPHVAGDAQAFELRAIKRRLLRRVGLLQRAGRDRRQLHAEGRTRNLVLFTSTRPGEGKTFAAINLAVSLALEEAMPVTLIDGDAARPKVRSYFGLDQHAGLTDRLIDPQLPLSAICRTADKAPLTVISEGARVPNATELFGSAQAKRFFAEISAIHPDGLVIIDAPPMLATTESIALARQADEVVFVIEADATAQPAVATALDEVLELNPNVSLLLNRCLIPAGGAHYGAYEYYEKRPAPGDDPTAGTGDNP